MIDFETLIKKFDKNDEYHQIIHMPQNVKLAYENIKVNIPQNIESILFNRIVIAGNQYAQIAAEIIYYAFGDRYKIDVISAEDNVELDDDTLLIICSYSGNEKEFLEFFEEAKENEMHICGVTSGGSLENLMQENYIYAKVLPDYPEHYSIVQTFFGLLKILEELKIIPNQKAIVKSTVANLIQKAGSIAKANSEELNIAKTTAAFMCTKNPAIFISNDYMQPLAKRWAQQFSRIVDICLPIFNLTHFSKEELEEFNYLSISQNVFPIILREFREKDISKQNLEFFYEKIHNNNLDYFDFFADGGSVVEKIFSLMYLGEMVAYYFGILRKLNME